MSNALRNRKSGETHRMSKYLYALLLLGVLAGCQTSQISIPDMSSPIYAGAIIPIERPIQLTASPLNRNVKFSMDTIESIIGTNSSSNRIQIEGLVESYRLGPNIQVRYTMERIGTGGSLKTVPPLIVQATLDKAARIETAEFGGPLLDYIDKSELGEMRKNFASTIKFIYANTTVRPLVQGDVVQSLKILDMLRDTGINLPVGVISSGPGLAAKLIGRTVYDGRSAFLLAIEGSETISGYGDGFISMSITGYGIIDETTGLYSATKTLTHVTGRSYDGNDLQMQQLDNTSLRF